MRVKCSYFTYTGEELKGYLCIWRIVKLKNSSFQKTKQNEKKNKKEKRKIGLPYIILTIRLMNSPYYRE